MVSFPAQTLIVTCKLLDLLKKEIFWKGKNVKADELRLQVPMHDLDADFGDNGNTLVCCNAYAKIRNYDLREDRKKPTIDFTMPVDKSPLSRIKIVDENVVVASNYDGGLYAFDRRKDLQIIKKMGFSLGAITDMDINLEGTVLATGKHEISFCNTDSQSR
jgi:hypothetical protein